MAFGVEGRVPYLDGAFSSFGFALPDEMKIQNGEGKWILKNWLARHIGKEKVFTKKRGFTVPIRHWLNNKRPQLKEYFAHHPAFKGVLNDNKLQSLLNKSLNKRQAKVMFSVLCYALWYDIHVQKDEDVVVFKEIINNKDQGDE